MSGAGRPPRVRPAPSAAPTPSGATTTPVTPPGRTSRRRSAPASADPRAAPRERRAPRRPDVSPSTAKQASVHSTNRSPSPRPSRASVPAMFWLVFSVAVPIRSVLRTVSVQYSQESRHANTKPTSVATDRRRRGDDQRAGVAAQQEVQQEHRGGQLQRDRHAEQHAARPRRLARHAVGDHQRHQHDVDLAEVEVRPDRLQVDHRGRDDRRGQPAPPQPRGLGGDGRSCGHTSRRVSTITVDDDQQHEGGHGDRGARRRQRQQRERRERDRRQRRIGERQVEAGSRVRTWRRRRTAACRRARPGRPCGRRRCRCGTACGRAAASRPRPAPPAVSSWNSRHATVGHQPAPPGDRQILMSQTRLSACRGASGHIPGTSHPRSA